MKTLPLKVSAAEMRSINRSAVMEFIRANSPTFRSEIAEALNISLPTVMRIVDEWVAAGFVIETDERAPSGGRRRQLLKFNAQGNLVIGVDLGGTKCYGAVANMDGAILCERTLTHHATRREESYAMLEGLIADLLADARGMAGIVRGVCVGVPGVVAVDDGVVQVCPALDWENFPLQERLNHRFNPNGRGTPVVIENDVNLAALGELWFGLEEEVESLVLVAVGTGVGAGVVVNGMVFPGAQGMAGEIGYLLPDRASLEQTYPGFGALEQRISGTGIAARARQILAERQVDAENITAEAVFAAARQGEDWARTVLAETVDGLAQAVAAIQLVLNPEIILLSGGVMRAGDLLVEPVLKRLEGRIPQLPRLLLSRLDYRAGVLGGVVKIFRRQAGLFRVMKVV